MRSAWIAAVLLLETLTGCAMPQQLLLPEPGATASVGHGEARGRRHGVPFGEPPTHGAMQPSLMRGTGDLIGSPNPLSSTPPASAGDAVTLSLSQAGIPAAAKAVLGDMLRYNYTVSEKVTGTISLHTPHAVSRARLLEMFEVALQGQGAGVVANNGIYRIVPLQEALAAGARIQSKGGSARTLVGVSTEIVQLRNVSAVDMERLLKSVAPKSSAVRIDPQRNLVILTGSRGDLAALNDAISVFDVDWMKGMSFGIVPIESADPAAIAQELDVVFGNDRQGGSSNVVRFVPNRRLKSILVISASLEHLRKAKQWISKLDQVGRATEKQVHVYRVQNRSAPEVAQLLQKVYSGRTTARAQTQPGAPDTASITTGALPQTAAPGTPPAANAAAAPASIPGLPELPRVPVAAPATEGGDTQQAAATATAPASDAGATNGLDRPFDDRASAINIVADQSNNTLVITATADEYQRMRQVLARIDVAPRQVLLEATIAEVTLTDELKLGVRWFVERGKHQFKLTDSVIGEVAPVFPGFSYFLNNVNVQVVLNTLATITNVNVVSSPTLMAMDNKKAVLQVGDEVPIATQSAVGVLAPGAPIVNSVTFRNTGIILGITPRISDRGRVLLDIEQEASGVVRTTTSNIDSPTIQQRRIRTTVAVGDGESVVLAGLIQDKATRERGQIPLLGDLPYVGNLFKNKTDTILRTELIVAITPRIVNDGYDMRSIVEEFRDKLNFNTRPQRRSLPTRREQIDRLQR